MEPSRPAASSTSTLIPEEPAPNLGARAWSPAGRRKTGGRSGRFAHEFLPALIFLLPGAALFIVFFLGPMLYSLNISFFDWKIIHPDRSVFVGLKNYTETLADPVFQRAVLNTVVYTIATVILQMATGLGLALLLNQRFRGRGFFRTAYYLPVISSWVIVSLLFSYLFNSQAGLINYLLKDVLHLVSANIRWFGDDKLVLVPLTVLGVWKGVGWTMVIYLAGLQAIPEQLFEAARVDGANPLQQLRYITLPLLRPTLVFLVVVLVIGGLNAYVSFQLMTNKGDPVNLAHSVLTWMYKTTFSTGTDFGKGAAISYLLTIFVFLISLVQLKLLRRPSEV
jgi:multiple sugar transport system permease protein